ncbi:MAG TPA: hypothetical protein VEX65_10150 [Flavisolibacter sp.]|nr:hypothetical protein [Flavisolibacter sp.]
MLNELTPLKSVLLLIKVYRRREGRKALKPAVIISLCERNK